MPTPFLGLAPHEPRIFDVPYEANLGVCFDQTDVSDATDVTDQGGEEVVI